MSRIKPKKEKQDNDHQGKRSVYYDLGFVYTKEVSRGTPQQVDTSILRQLDKMGGFHVVVPE